MDTNRSLGLQVFAGLMSDKTFDLAMVEGYTYCPGETYLYSPTIDPCVLVGPKQPLPAHCHHIWRT